MKTPARDVGCSRCLSPGSVHFAFKARRTRFRLFRLGAMLGIPVLVVVAGILNHRWLRVREYTIEVPGKSAAVKALTIAFAADLHLGAITDRRFMETFVASEILVIRVVFRNTA